MGRFRTTDSKTIKKLKVGDKVMSDYDMDHADTVRTITEVEHNADTGSTVRIWANGGDPCPCCGREPAKSINGVDGAWFIPAVTENKK